MIRSNSKEFKTKVKAYILEHISEEYLTECGYNANTEDAKIISLVECMKSEWWKGYEKQRFPNRYVALKEYLLGLPSAFSTDFYYFNQRQILKQWYEQTETESDKLTDDQIADKFYHQITLNFYNMYDKATKQ